MEILQQLLNLVAEKAPFMISFIGVARLIFKPLVSFIDKFVEATPSPKDNVFWEGVKGSPYYKAVAWVVDLIFSIKLPAPKAR